MNKVSRDDIEAGRNFIYLGHSLSITSKKGKPAVIYTYPGLLKISASRCFSKKLLKDEKLMSKTRGYFLKNPDNYRVKIAVNDEKDLINWKLEVVFSNPVTEDKTVVFTRPFRIGDAVKIKEYLFPYIKLLDRGIGIERVTEYLYSILN
jgi:hypothetical protein